MGFHFADCSRVVQNISGLNFHHKLIESQLAIEKKKYETFKYILDNCEYYDYNHRYKYISVGIC